MSESSAIFSPCRTWRYTLERIWWPQDQHWVAFIGLNPSTADEVQDDPTVRRCIGFAKSWGFGRMLMLNIFAYRATLPRDLRAAQDPVGPMNDTWLIGSTKRASLVVAAWGTHGVYQNRHQNILKIFQNAGTTLHCLRVTKDGLPGHPLYLPRNLAPIIYEGKPC